MVVVVVIAAIAAVVLTAAILLLCVVTTTAWLASCWRSSWPTKLQRLCIGVMLRVRARTGSECSGWHLLRLPMLAGQKPVLESRDSRLQLRHLLPPLNCWRSSHTGVPLFLCFHCRPSFDEQRVDLPPPLCSRLDRLTTAIHPIKDHGRCHRPVGDARATNG